MNSFFLVRNLLLLIFSMNDQEFVASLPFMFSLITSSKLIIFVSIYYIVIYSLLFHILDLSLFHMDMFLLNQLIAFLSLFELKAILLISSVNTLCLSVLNRGFVFDINLLFFMFSRVLHDLFKDILR